MIRAAAVLDDRLPDRGARGPAALAASPDRPPEMARGARSRARNVRAQWWTSAPATRPRSARMRSCCSALAAS